MGKSNKIITGLRLLLILAGITLLAITGYVVIQYQRKQSSIVPHYETVLQKKGKEYEQKITAFFDTQEKNAASQCTSPELISALQTLKSALNDRNTPTSKADTMPSEVQQNEKFKSATLAIEKNIKEFIARTRESGEFKNLLLATVEGDVIFSLNQPKYLGINLRHKPNSETDLGYSFARTLMSFAPDISAFYYDEVINQPALYISLSIFADGKREGILIAQIDHTKVYQMTRNYLELGKTGEFVTAEKIGNKAQIIAPTRLSPHIAFKRSGLEEPGLNIPIQDAINAKRGTGFGYDYRNKYVLAFWNYLPGVDWGYDVKIDSDEINAFNTDLKNVMLFLIILTLMLWSAIALSFQSVRAFIHSGTRQFLKRIPLRLLSFNAALLLFLLSSSAALYIYYSLHQSQNKALVHAKSTAQRVGSEAIKQIQHDLENISSMVKGVTTYLQDETFSKEDLIVNLQRKINEEPTLFAFCVAFNQQKKDSQKAFAPYATRKDGKTELMQLEDILKAQDQSFMTQQWFKEAIEQNKGTWIQPTKELLTDKLVVIYAEPFFDPNDTNHEKPLGVSAAFYLVDNVKRYLGNLHIGETGYPSIVNQKGKFVYHPLNKYDSENTLLTEAEQTDNIPLNAIDKRILEGKEGVESYFGMITNRMMWVSYQPIPIIGWSLVLRFVEQEITPPAEHAHHQRMWIIICIVLALLFLGNALIVFFTTNKLRALAFTHPPIFILGILGIWSLVKPDIGVKNGIVIYNAIGLDAYVDELTKDARQRHEPEPILLPTGLFLESWGIAPTKVDITGTLWQIYNEKSHHGIVREFNLPDATSVKLSNQYKHQEKGNSTVGSSINATIAQQFDFSKFPLDSQRIRITMDHKDLEKNVLLIPDLESYDSISPTELPGLDKEFKYYGFTIQRSFFSLEKSKENTDFGIQAYSGISEHIKLNYNIIIIRDLMNALIVFFMPLLVILISLFAIFAVTGRTGKKGNKKTFVSIASYTGLLFALVALNIALRSQYPSGNVLYLEYFFFYTYLTILVLIVHGAFVQVETYEDVIDEKITPTLKNLFWPVQLAIWFITTIFVFYT